MPDNLISSYPNSPAGIYPAVLCKSKIVPYPRGERQVLEFLILKDNEKEPLTNEVGNDCSASIICNPSDGTNPKSKIYKVIRAMLKEHESDPIKSSIIIPKLEHFLPSNDKPNRVVYVEVEIKNKLSLISKIKNSRESNKWHPINGVFEGNQKIKNSRESNKWHPINGVFEGNQKIKSMSSDKIIGDEAKNFIVLFEKIKSQIPEKDLRSCSEKIRGFGFKPFTKDGELIPNFNFNSKKVDDKEFYKRLYKKIELFLKTKDYHTLL